MVSARILLVLSALLISVGVANADEVGEVGTVVGLQINTGPGDTYLLYHGRMYVNADSGLEEYRWGGTSCGTRVLTEGQTAALQRALDNKQMRIQPLYQIGQGSALCVVGFTLVSKKSLKLGIP